MADEQEQLDSEIKAIEQQIKALESGTSSDYGFPSAEKKDSTFRFFKEILQMVDTTRVGNLATSELGEVKVGVRDYQHIANYAEAEGLELVAEYLRAKSNVITATSMSKKGFWAQLFVTNIKKEQKVKDDGKKKTTFFGKPKEEAD